MALWDKIAGEFIDIIEWTDDTQDTIVYRFERHNNEIKYGAQLTVRESQVAVFVNEGQIADVFQPGMVRLETRNLPILSTLQGWKYGFESPFKAEVYFLNTKRFTDLKWGTMNPVMLRDPEFGPVRLRAFGTYAIRVKDPAAFIREIAGTDGRFTTDEITDQLRNLIVTSFAGAVAKSNIPVLDLSANYDQLGKVIRDAIQPEFDAYGLEVATLLVENVSLPEEVEKALDRRSSMGVVGDLGRYTQYQTAEAIKAAAENPGGAAGIGIGMATGGGLAAAMGAAVQQGAQPATGSAPPPLPGSEAWHVAIDGKQAGPFPAAELQGLVRDGRLTRESLVWIQGMANWTRAGEVAGLAALFADQPPPLPPA
ncbi:SPFH domain-containing protein [Inquilinus sp. Marseille-Q2685]|uniref:SPFH domain-containing protein n=1 Tax=Inquilinus sp. Marseille-Q2685 TaxID=2866581 RepID=UPI001CE46804|nr:SPFH domain-containing protein [Inquilinus sp. Marseille-Q2685]